MSYNLYSIDNIGFSNRLLNIKKLKYNMYYLLYHVDA